MGAHGSRKPTTTSSIVTTAKTSVFPFNSKTLVIEKGMAFGCCPAPRRLELVDDYLVITQIERGPFIHDGPETYDEVLQEDRRAVPGLKEEKVKTWLEKEVGK